MGERRWAVFPHLTRDACREASTQPAGSSRHSPAVPALIPGSAVDPDTIPIIVQDSSEFLHYLAGEADLRAVMRLLPPGALDGLRRIVLCAGIEYQQEYQEEEGGDNEIDSYIGRLGVEILPGVYSGPVLGTYYFEDA